MADAPAKRRPLGAVDGNSNFFKTVLSSEPPSPKVKREIKQEHYDHKPIIPQYTNTSDLKPIIPRSPRKENVSPLRTLPPLQPPMNTQTQIICKEDVVPLRIFGSRPPRPMSPALSNENTTPIRTLPPPPPSSLPSYVATPNTLPALSPSSSTMSLPSTTSSLKRKASELSFASSSDEFYWDTDLSLVTDDCDQVRRKCRSFLLAGELTIAQFSKEIGLEHPNSYTRFMNQRGKAKGRRNECYAKAFWWFKNRETQGIKMPKKKVKRGEEKVNDVSEVKLEGEKEVAVEVYDSCDEIRRKVNAYLREPGVTQAGFLRDIAKTYEDGRKIQSKVLNDFLMKKGASAGNRSAVFYSSYVFFEKVRIRDGRPKSRHRLDMEKLYKEDGGFDTKSGAGGKVGGRGGGNYTYCFEGEDPWEDHLGQIHYE